MVSTSPSGAPLQFVCTTCWYVFNNEALPACEGCGSIAPDDGFPTMPYEFWQYLFVEQLGRGGMGAVFRAYDKRAPDRPWVAVKVAQLHGTNEDRIAKERAFAREVRAAAALSEYIKYFVGFRAADYNGKPAYLALDFIDWPTLKKLKMQLGTFPPGDVAKIGAAILRGIRWMERKNIVHRDLKPENIFARRSPDGSFEAKIADLGVWVDAGTTEDSLWNSADVAQVVGSPSYMSPEQTRGNALTTASDVHALGSILFELTTGYVPYPINYSLSLLEAVRERHERMREVPARPANMPEGLYWILSSALCFEPTKRVFTDANVSHSSDASIARWMEKALDKFAADYSEQQRQALAAARDRLGGLDRSITSSEAKLTPAFLLADRVRQIRSRISYLRDDTVEANLPEAVILLSSEVDSIALEVAQLFEDREARQALAHAQQDLAREEDARIQRDIERDEGRAGDARGRADSNQVKTIAQGARFPSYGDVVNASRGGPDVVRRWRLFVMVALASCLAVGFTVGYLYWGRGENSQAITPSINAATSVHVNALPTSAFPASSVDTLPSAAHSAGSVPEAKLDAGIANQEAASADAGVIVPPPAPAQEDGAKSKQTIVNINDLPDTPSKSAPSTSAIVIPVLDGGASPLAIQPALFNFSAAASAFSAAESSVSGCKSEGEPSGSGVVTVTFAPSGRVTSAVITGGPLVGTTIGGCVARLFRLAHVPAFDGPPKTIQESFTVP